MNLTEALPFLEQNHTAIVSTVTATGSTHATVVSAGLCDGQVAFVSRGDTVKVKNALKRGRLDQGADSACSQQEEIEEKDQDQQSIEDRQHRSPQRQ